MKFVIAINFAMKDMYHIQQGPIFICPMSMSYHIFGLVKSIIIKIKVQLLKLIPCISISMKVLESSTLKFVIMHLKFLSLFGNGKVYSLKRGYWANALKPTKEISLDISWDLEWDVM